MGAITPLFILLLLFYSGTDAMKLVFALLINPVVSELSVLTSRVTARASRHNHATTSWVLISVTVIYKKLFSRFIIGSVSSFALLTLCTALLALVELTARATMPIRDAFMYRRVFGAYLDNDMNAVALMTNVRSRGLRAETEMIEGITDWIFLINVAAFPFVHKISLNGN